MRLRELKCENCGATIKIEENATKAKCEYCQTESRPERIRIKQSGKTARI